MDDKTREMISRDIRYMDYYLFDEPVIFSKWKANKDVDAVFIHSILKYKNSLIGFAGAFTWKDDYVISLDGDNYSKDMIVYGFKWSVNEDNEPILNILVENW